MTVHLSHSTKYTPSIKSTPVNVLEDKSTVVVNKAAWVLNWSREYICPPAKVLDVMLTTSLDLEVVDRREIIGDVGKEIEVKVLLERVRVLVERVLSQDDRRVIERR